MPETVSLFTYGTALDVDAAGELLAPVFDFTFVEETSVFRGGRHLRAGEDGPGGTTVVVQRNRDVDGGPTELAWSGPTVLYVEIHSSDPESDPLTGHSDFTLLSQSAWVTDGAAPPRPERVPVAAPPLRRAFSRFRRE